MKISKSNSNVLKFFILIAICLCSFFVVNFTTPTQNIYAESDSNYTISQDGTITAYNGPQNGMLTVPDQINGITVKKIGPNVFRSSYIYAIRLPDTVIELGDYCFYGSSISSISASNVETIGNYAFQNTSRLTHVSMGSVKTIGNYAFQNSSNLHGVTFPYVTKIGDFAFQNTIQLSSAQFNNIETIGNYAFENCGRADVDTTIQLSSRLQSIGEAAFANNHISSFYNPSGNSGSNFTINNSNIIRKSDYKVVALAFGNGQKNFYFDSFTKGFDSYALKGSCKTFLIDAINGVVQFEDYAFDSATIENLNISALRCRFMDSAFCNAKITNFTLDSENIESENNRTFQSAQIHQLTIGENVSSIPSNTFYGLKIKRLAIESESTNLSNYSFNLTLWDNPSFKLEALILNFETKEGSYYQSLQYTGLVPNVASIYIPNSVVFVLTNPLNDLGYTKLLEKDGYKIFSKAGGVATINASATTGASITPSGTTKYIKGETVTFDISLSAGYKITSIMVDGTSVSTYNMTSYTFKDISSGQHSIVVNTEKIKYTMFVNPGEGGTISPNEIVVEYGDNLTFTVTPNNGYKIKTVTYQTSTSTGTTYGTAVTPENLESFTISNIKANYKITATFEKLSYTITVSVGEGGTVSPTGTNISVEHGDDKTFTFTPNDGYEIADVLVNSSSIGINSSYTFNNVTENQTLEVVFSAIDYTFTYNLNFEGSSNPTQTYTVGQTILPVENPTRPNYEFGGWYTEAECLNEYTFNTMPASDVEVFAKWNINKYTITWLNYDNSLLGTTQTPHGEIPTYTGNTPTKPATDQVTYTFNTWTPELVAATQNTTYTATFTESPRLYKVTFYLDDGTKLNEAFVEYGTMVSFGPTNPIKQPTAQYSYTFEKWVTEIDGDQEADLSNITKDTNVYAKFTETINKYTITFVNYDNSELDSQELEYGETPVYAGSTPTKPDDGSNSYTFSGWNPTISTVTGDVTYTAVFDVSGKFSVKFYSDDGLIIIKQIYVNPGETATFELEPPTKEPTAQYSYTFEKWVTTPNGDTEADLTNITENTSFYAKFTETINKYIITFVNYDNTELDSQELEYGKTPVYAGSTPTKPSTNEFTFTFMGWDPELGPVVSAQTYTAVYSQGNVYTVQFYSDDGITLLYTCYVESGKDATFDGEPTKQPTAQYSYIFEKWVTEIDGDIEADLTNITANTNVYAKFTPTINRYTITFVNYDDSILQQSDFDYGELPEYTGDTPTRPASNEHSYSFIGWMPAIATVTDDATYTARYSTSDKYVVTFFSEDGSTQLDECYVGYGENAEYNGPTPEKPSTAEYSYVFKEWVTEPHGSVKDNLTDVIKSRNVYASFTAIKNKYTIKFVNYDNTVLKEEKYEYGKKPLYNSALPQRPATAQYTYEFVGWSPEVDFVTGEATYTAIYNAITNTYKISVKVGKNGVVSPGTVELEYGKTQVFEITPNENYEISKILIDETPVEIKSTIEIANINQNHTISVEFTKIMFMITTTTDDNGRITPSTSVEIHGTHRIDFYPNEGYTIKDVKIDNVSIGIVPFYTFVSITQHHTIAVEYEVKSYTLTTHVDGKGFVAPTNTISVNHGDEIMITLTPEEGWEILKLYVNGESYTVKNNQVIIPCITEDVHVQAVFAIPTSDTIGSTIVVIAAIVASLAICLVFAYLLIKHIKGSKSEEKGFDDLAKNLQKLNRNKPEDNLPKEEQPKNNTKAQAQPEPKAINDEQDDEEIDPRIRKAQELKHQNDLFIQNIKNLQKKPAQKPVAQTEQKVAQAKVEPATNKAVAEKPAIQTNNTQNKVEPVQKPISTPKTQPLKESTKTSPTPSATPTPKVEPAVKPVPQKPVVAPTPKPAPTPVVEPKPMVEPKPVVEHKPNAEQKAPAQEPIVTAPTAEASAAVEDKSTGPKVIPPARPKAPKIPVRRPIPTPPVINKDVETLKPTIEEKVEETLSSNTEQVVEDTTTVTEVKIEETLTNVQETVDKVEETTETVEEQTEEAEVETETVQEQAEATEETTEEVNETAEEINPTEDSETVEITEEVEEPAEVQEEQTSDETAEETEEPETVEEQTEEAEVETETVQEQAEATEEKTEEVNETAEEVEPTEDSETVDTTEEVEEPAEVQEEPTSDETAEETEEPETVEEQTEETEVETETVQEQTEATEETTEEVDPAEDSETVETAEEVEEPAEVQDEPTSDEITEEPETVEEQTEEAEVETETVQEQAEATEETTEEVSKTAEEVEPAETSKKETTSTKKQTGKRKKNKSKKH